MSTIDEIAKEKQRIGEELARIDAQREKLANELGDLEAAERVLARYAKSARAKTAARATEPATNAIAPAPSHARRRSVAAKSATSKRNSPTLGDQVLALATGKTQREIITACAGARPNHVGGVISRHKRAGRIEERDGKLYATHPTATEQVAGV